jgi:hypothetical protein
VCLENKTGPLKMVIEAMSQSAEGPWAAESVQGTDHQSAVRAARTCDARCVFGMAERGRIRTSDTALAV